MPKAWVLIIALLATTACVTTANVPLGVTVAPKNGAVPVMSKVRSGGLLVAEIAPVVAVKPAIIEPVVVQPVLLRSVAVRSAIVQPVPLCGPGAAVFVRGSSYCVRDK